MLYQKEIDDSVLIQCIILYTLSKADGAVKYDALLNLVLDNCNINYGDFQVSLDNLVKTNHVSAFFEGERSQKFEVTEKGRLAGELFASSIPVYISEPIEQSIKALFLEERRKNAVQGDIIPVRKNEFGAECVLRDDDNTELMRLSLYAGERSEAGRMAEFFRSNPETVYGKIIDIFT